MSTAIKSAAGYATTCFLFLLTCAALLTGCSESSSESEPVSQQQESKEPSPDIPLEYIVRTSLVFYINEVKSEMKNCREIFEMWQEAEANGVVDQASKEDGTLPQRIRSELLPGIKQVCVDMELGGTPTFLSGKEKMETFFSWYFKTVDPENVSVWQRLGALDTEGTK